MQGAGVEGQRAGVVAAVGRHRGRGVAPQERGHGLVAGRGQRGSRWRQVWAVSGNPWRQRASGPSAGPVGRGRRTRRRWPRPCRMVGWSRRSWSMGRRVARGAGVAALACSPCADHLLRRPGLVPVLVRPATPLRGEHLLRAGRGGRRAAPGPRHGDGPARARPPPRLRRWSPPARRCGPTPPDPPALRPRARAPHSSRRCATRAPLLEIYGPGPGRRLAAGDHGRHGQAAVLPRPHGATSGASSATTTSGPTTSSPSAAITVKARADPPHRQHARVPHRGRRRGRWPTCPTTRRRSTGRRSRRGARAVRRRRPADPRRPVHRGRVRRAVRLGPLDPGLRRPRGRRGRGQASRHCSTTTRPTPTGRSTPCCGRPGRSPSRSGKVEVNAAKEGGTFELEER